MKIRVSILGRPDWLVQMVHFKAWKEEIELRGFRETCPLVFSSSLWNKTLSDCSQGCQLSFCCSALNLFVTDAQVSYALLTGKLGVESSKAQDCLDYVQVKLITAKIGYSLTDVCSLSAVNFTLQCWESAIQLQADVPEEDVSSIISECPSTAVDSDQGCTQCMNAMSSALSHTNQGAYCSSRLAIYTATKSPSLLNSIIPCTTAQTFGESVNCTYTSPYLTLPLDPFLSKLVTSGTPISLETNWWRSHFLTILILAVSIVKILTWKGFRESEIVNNGESDLYMS